jgi:hypothetical protein
MNGIGGAAELELVISGATTRYSIQAELHAPQIFFKAKDPVRKKKLTYRVKCKLQLHTRI